MSASFMSTAQFLMAQVVWSARMVQWWCIPPRMMDVSNLVPCSWAMGCWVPAWQKRTTDAPRRLWRRTCFRTVCRCDVFPTRPNMKECSVNLFNKHFKDCWRDSLFSLQHIPHPCVRLGRMDTAPWTSSPPDTRPSHQPKTCPRKLPSHSWSAVRLLTRNWCYLLTFAHSSSLAPCLALNGDPSLKPSTSSGLLLWVRVAKVQALWKRRPRSKQRVGRQRLKPKRRAWIGRNISLVMPWPMMTWRRSTVQNSWQNSLDIWVHSCWFWPLAQAFTLWGKMQLPLIAPRLWSPMDPGHGCWETKLRNSWPTIRAKSFFANGKMTKYQSAWRTADRKEQNKPKHKTRQQDTSFSCTNT